MPSWFPLLQQNATILLASVLLIIVLFLIARVARLSQPLALALALTPTACAVALNQGAMLGLI
ncbi:MAG: hypothetical protein JWQ89_335 [Devosia sp.]|uniref:hypothetical protein n=1 Tax=Devosia sp. TaxID=1871048 RepID=UPI0026108651|nr:hypothetical protein [Devosia sp.]MDB5538608.1 hypothetical protein [Devosia sp.]